MKSLAAIFLGSFVIGLAIAVTSANALPSRLEAPGVTAPPNGAGGGNVLAQNPDGTWTRWGPWHPTPVREYPAGGYRNPLSTWSDSQISAESRIYRALELETGVTKQTAKDVEGISHLERERAVEEVSKLRTGAPYATAGEQAVGEQIVADATAGGFFPKVATVFDALNGVAAGVGVAYVGVSIGNGIDRLLGTPTLPFGLFSEGGTHSGARTVEYIYHEDRKVKWLKMKPCLEIFSEPSTEKCQFVQTEWKVEEKFYEGEELFFTGMKDQYYGVPYSFTGPTTLQPPCPTAPWITCRVIPEGADTSIYTYVPARRTGYMKGAAFPAEKLNEKYAPSHTGEHETPAIEAVEPIHKQPAVPPPAQIAPVQEYLTATVPELKPTEGAEVPDPTKLVEVPPVEENELATHYKPRVETAGFTSVRINVLPDSQIDTRVGPDEVSKVTPASGTLISPATDVVIDTNPSNAPEPQEGSGGGGGGPTLPGIKLPKLGVACKNFPFGVPCWIVEEFTAWSATSKTPEWGIDETEVHGKKIPAAHISLAFLEPAMVILRPFMILFATIGIVILFYRWATGKNVGTTGDNVGPESSAEHGAWPEGDE